MLFVRRDVRGHTASQKNDHGASYRRYRALQRRSRLKIKFCESFGVVRFSSFATESGVERTMRLLSTLPSLTQMYGPAVRFKWIRRDGGERSCINVSGL